MYQCNADTGVSWGSEGGVKDLSVLEMVVVVVGDDVRARVVLLSSWNIVNCRLHA
jgi:hypothetical protein